MEIDDIKIVDKMKDPSEKNSEKVSPEGYLDLTNNSEKAWVFKREKKPEKPKETNLPQLDLKEIKKERWFNPKTKTFLIGIIIIFLFISLLTANMIWKNSILKKIAEKDFTPENTINVDPNINVTDADQTTNENFYNHTIIIYNNITLEFPENFSIKLTNSS